MKSFKESFSTDLLTRLKERQENTRAREKVTGLCFNNERQEVVQGFVDCINSDRDADGGAQKYGHVTWSQVNGQLRYYKSTADLRRFFTECKGKKCFSAYFWWKIKQSRS